MPSFTLRHRLPAGILALALIGGLSYVQSANAEEPEAPTTSDVVVVPPTDESTESHESDSVEGESIETESAETEPGTESTEPEAPEADSTESDSAPAARFAPAIALAAPTVEPLSCSGCSYTLVLPPVSPVACVATGGWAASDVNDVPAQVTAGGLVFTGQTKSVNYYQRVSQGNAQGITGMSYTVSNASGPYSVQMKVEILREGTTGYTTLSSNVPAGTTGVINPLNWTWYSSRTLTGPGSMSQPLPWADLIALFPNNVLVSAPSLHMQSSGAGSSGTVTAISSSCGSTTFPQTVAPVTCVAAPGWAASDPNDVAAELTANGLVFRGQTKSVNYYQRPATLSNAQGITGMTYTIAPGATGYGVQLKVEVNPRANLGGGTLVTYATLSTIQVPDVTPLTGTIDAQNSLWYTTKIASGPGSMASPLPWNQIIALMPNNTLLSTPSLHMQTRSSAADYAVVTSVSSSCGSSSFVTPPVTPVTPATPASPVTPVTPATSTTVTSGTTPGATPTPTPTPTATPTPTPEPSESAAEQLPTEAFGGDTTGDTAPWWPWVLLAAILAFLALLWFLLLRRRRGSES